MCPAYIAGLIGPGGRKSVQPMAFALRHPETTTVPIGNPNFVTTNGQDAVQWNRPEALALFNALNAGKPVPKGLIQGSNQAS